MIFSSRSDRVWNFRRARRNWRVQVCKALHESRRHVIWGESVSGQTRPESRCYVRFCRLSLGGGVNREYSDTSLFRRAHERRVPWPANAQCCGVKWSPGRLLAGYVTEHRTHLAAGRQISPPGLVNRCLGGGRRNWGRRHDHASPPTASWVGAEKPLRLSPRARVQQDDRLNGDVGRLL